MEEKKFGEPVSGARRNMRIKLIELKTDIEKAAPELEVVYREGLESSVNYAKECDLHSAITNFSFTQTIGDLIDKRVPGFEVSKKLREIEELAKKAIEEELRMYCGCKFTRKEQ